MCSVCIFDTELCYLISDFIDHYSIWVKFLPWGAAPFYFVSKTSGLLLFFFDCVSFLDFFIVIYKGRFFLSVHFFVVVFDGPDGRNTIFPVFDVGSEFGLFVAFPLDLASCSLDLMLILFRNAICCFLFCLNQVGTTLRDLIRLLLLFLFLLLQNPLNRCQSLRRIVLQFFWPWFSPLLLQIDSLFLIFNMMALFALLLSETFIVEKTLLGP